MLIVRKLQRFDLVATFILVALATVLADHLAVGLRHGAPRDAAVFAAVLLRLRHADRAADGADHALAAPRLRRPRRLPVRARTSISARSTSRRNWRSSSATSSPMLAGPKGRFVLTLERIEQAAADTYDFIFRRRASLPSRPASISNGRSAFDRPDNRGNRRYFTVASAPTEEAVRLGVKFYPSRAPSSARSARWRRATRSTPRSSPAASPCRPIRTPSSPSSPAASASRRSAACCSTFSTAARRGRSSSSTATRASEDIAYRDVLDAAGRELGIRTVHAVARGRAARPVSGLHRRATGARGHPRLSRAHLLHFRAAGDGEDAPPACCSRWASAGRG